MNMHWLSSTKDPNLVDNLALNVFATNLVKVWMRLMGQKSQRAEAFKHLGTMTSGYRNRKLRGQKLYDEFS